MLELVLAFELSGNAAFILSIKVKWRERILIISKPGTSLVFILHKRTTLSKMMHSIISIYCEIIKKLVN